MEMEYKDGSRRGRIVILLGVVLAIFAGIGAYALLSQKNASEQQAVATTSVVVATQDLLPRVPIQDGFVTLKVIPKDGVVEGVFTDPAKLIGQVPAVPIKAGQPIYPNMLANAATAAGFSILGPDETVDPSSPAWRAISLTIPDDRAVAGTLVQGEVVDLFMTATINVPAASQYVTYVTGPSTKIVYQSVQILGRTGSLYIIRATVDMAEEILHMMATGSVQFSAALRPDKDVRWVDASRLGATTYRILEKYGMPLPKVWPDSSGAPPTNPPLIFPTPPPTPGPTPTAAPSLSPAP